MALIEASGNSFAADLPPFLLPPLPLPPPPSFLSLVRVGFPSRSAVAAAAAAAAAAGVGGGAPVSAPGKFCLGCATSKPLPPRSLSTKDCASEGIRIDLRREFRDFFCLAATGGGAAAGSGAGEAGADAAAGDGSAPFVSPLPPPGVTIVVVAGRAFVAVVLLDALLVVPINTDGGLLVTAAAVASPSATTPGLSRPG